MSAQLPIEVRFLKRYARRMHQSGVPAHQLEAMVTAIGRRLGLECQVWSSPTAVFLACQYLDDDDDQRPIPLQLIRGAPGLIDIGRTTDLYELGEDIFEGRITAEEAHRALKFDDATLPFPLWLRSLCWGLASCGVAVLLAASWPGVITAAVIGMLLGLFFADGGESLRQGGMEAIAALFATMVVYTVSYFLPGTQVGEVVMASLIVLIPGLGLTIGVTELSTDHLSSGSARLAGALVTLLKLSLGVLIGTVFVGWLGWLDQPAAPLDLPRPPAWFQVPALLGSAFGFAVLFSVKPRDFPIAMAAAIISYVVSRVASAAGGIEFGVLCASLTIALMANLVCGRLKRPGSLIRSPGIILLVPGSIGYRAATDALVGQTGTAQETAWLVATVVISLVGGLLIGNTLVAPPRHL